jgi:hypothetical protein
MGSVDEHADDRLVVLADAELAGVVQDAVTKAGLDDRIEVEYHPWIPAGCVVARGRCHPWDLVSRCYAHLGALLQEGPP